ncbi:MAG: hypothetical protein ABIF11_06340 [Nitrospirota bacterium]
MMETNLAFLKEFETGKIEYKEAKETLPQSIWKTISANNKPGIYLSERKYGLKGFYFC